MSGWPGKKIHTRKTRPWQEKKRYMRMTSIGTCLLSMKYLIRMKKSPNLGHVFYYLQTLLISLNHNGGPKTRADDEDLHPPITPTGNPSHQGSSGEVEVSCDDGQTRRSKLTNLLSMNRIRKGSRKSRKKKKEKSTARKEKKATQTLAIVLGMN